MVSPDGSWLGTQHLLDHGPAVAEATLDAARRAGVTWLDTADVYGPGPGDVERFLATRRSGFLVATKVGLTRTGGRWTPDGRPGSIAAAIDASVARLGPIDLLWWHAPDPRTDVRATGRALRRALDAGRVRAVGACNLRVPELRALVEVVPVTAVQVELSRGQRAVVRSGIVEEARRLGLPVLAWRPLGGRDRARRTLADPAVTHVARRHGAPPAAVVLAWLRDLGVIPVPGTADPAHVPELVLPVPLDDEDRAALDAGTEVGARLRGPRSARRPAAGGPEVVLVCGTPGAGKTRRVAALPRHVRLNRDALGGTLDGLLAPLAAALEAGRDVVLDNTYASRASRSGVVDTAWRCGARVRCEWLDTPDGEAERNVVSRLLDTVGRLLADDELVAANRSHPEVLPIQALHRFRAEWEPPEVDEGFERVDRIPFVRAPSDGRAGLSCGPDDLHHPAVRAAHAAGEAVLVTAWRPGTDAGSEAAAIEAEALDRGLHVVAGVCPHPGGPPRCWCRPPLPGLWVALARRAGAELSRVRVLASTPTERTVARRLGLAVVDR
jgi:aryl-alcohol dehydrogenase-like predicted oxidoreductase